MGGDGHYGLAVADTPRYDGAGSDSVTSGQTDASGLLLFRHTSSHAALPVDLSLAMWTAVERADR